VPRIGILGSGFGLYGYLPAVCQASRDTVLLLARSRPAFESRPALRPLADRIQWIDDERDLYYATDLLIVARRPQDQEQIVAHLPRDAQVRRLLLEKPLATSPARAEALLQHLDARDVALTAGFTLAMRPWAASLALPTPSIRISWHFRAHHFVADVNTWKRDPQQGGGALRFYGMHLLAALTRHAGPAPIVVASTIDAVGTAEAVRWRARVTGASGTAIDLEIDTDSEQTRFFVHAGNACVYDAPSPFVRPMDAGTAITEREDPRVPELVALLQDPTDHRRWSAQTVALWRAVEAATR
jgi:predicted dehydrogenase